MADDSSRPGYIQVLRRNDAFRRFMIAQLVSFAGDWISMVALYGLVLSLGGNGVEVSLLMVCSLTPHVLIGPIGGLAADRYNRKLIMVFADLARTFLVLSFLFIHRASQLWIIYPVLVAVAVLDSFYFPASESAFPNLVGAEELYTANALAGASWGTMLAVGAAAGGVISLLLGREACFAIDSASFLFSALVTLSIKRPFSPPKHPEKPHAGWRDFKRALAYAVENPTVGYVILFYGALGWATGVVVLYSIFASRVFHDGDFGIGVLYSLRGAGALAGPLLIRRFVGEDLRSIRLGLAWACAIIGGFYLALSRAPALTWGAAAVFCAHVGNGGVWMLAGFFLQKYVPNEYLGRISSLYVSIFTLMMAASSLLCGYYVGRVSPREVALVSGVIVLAAAAGWGRLTRRAFA